MSDDTNPIAISGLDHVVLRVADMDRALAFYCGVLGCVEERRVEGMGLVQLRAGASMIDLVPAGEAPPERAGRNMHHLALRLRHFDAEALARHLRAHGYEPGEVKRRYGAEGYGPSLYVTDPDGNTVELKGPAEAPADAPFRMA